MSGTSCRRIAVPRASRSSTSRRTRSGRTTPMYPIVVMFGARAGMTRPTSASDESRRAAAAWRNVEGATSSSCFAPRRPRPGGHDRPGPAHRASNWRPPRARRETRPPRPLRTFGRCDGWAPSALAPGRPARGRSDGLDPARSSQAPRSFGSGCRCIFVPAHEDITELLGRAGKRGP